MREDLNSLTEMEKQELLNAARQIIAEKSEDESTTWYDAKKKSIDEVEFYAWFMRRHPLMFVSGVFYDIDGFMRMDKLIKEIVEELKPYVKSAIIRKANQKVEALKYEALCDAVPKHTDQEGKLLMIDDDMKMEALSDTGRLKAIVTMEDKMDLERKGQQSYQGYLYVRIMVFGNGALSSLYDKSDGFYRRQIALLVKPKPENRIDDRNLSEKLAVESEGIVLWCLEGLKRLAANEFHFTVSDRTKMNQSEMRKDEDSIMDFFESEGYITYDKKALCSTKELYEAYQLWADENLVRARSESSFSREVKQRASKLGIEYLKNVSIDGRTARGYRGIYADHTLKDVPFEVRKGA